MKEEEKEIDLHHDDVNEILSDIPGSLLRWGITVIFIILIGVIVMSAYIRYPDIIMAPITITTANPPAELVARSTGKLSALMVKDNQQVKEKQILAIIENTAEYSDVLLIDSMLIKYNSIPDTDFESPKNPVYNLQLGDLMPSYTQFLKADKEYRLYIELNPQQRQITILNQQINEHRQLQNKYINQEKIYAQELELITNDYNRDTELFNSKVISSREYEQKKKEYLQAVRNHENMKITISNGQISISNLEKNMLQLQIESKKEISIYIQNYNKSLDDLKNAIKTWKQNYVIQSPVNGRVTFFNFWAENQNIKAGDIVFSVVPETTTKMIGKVIMPIQNSGKVKVGQKAIVKLNNYPYEQFGMLEGEIINISSLPKQNNYSVDIALPEQLKTTFNKILPYQNEMQGNVSIVTEDLSLLDRVFYQFRKLIYSR